MTDHATAGSEATLQGFARFGICFRRCRSMRRLTVDSAAVKVLLVGSGGREHALAWKLAQAPGLVALHAAPGNPGIARLGDCHPVRAEDGEALLGLARSLDVDLALIGPEAPLVAGVADELRRNGVAVFGPGRSAARIEGSKSFAKEVMAAAGVPTASLAGGRTRPVRRQGRRARGGEGRVRLRDGRAARRRRCAPPRRFPGPIVIEELLAGEEVSVFALADGHGVVPLAPAQDFKRIGDGDTGPNTGGMGSYSPVPGTGRRRGGGAGRAGAPPGRRGAGAARVAVRRRALRGADADRRPARRCSSSTAVSAIRRRSRSCRGSRATSSARWRPPPAASSPASSWPRPTTPPSPSCSRPATIRSAPTPAPRSAGIEDAEADGALVFHAGTALRGDRLVTNGGRILGVTGTGATIAEARERAYAGCERITFAGARYRSDIALSASGRPPEVRRGGR